MPVEFLKQKGIVDFSDIKFYNFNYQIEIFYKT